MVMRATDLVPTKAPREDVGEVVSANATYGFIGRSGKAKVGELLGGVNLTQPSERARVDHLVQAISGENGYFERLIIDGEGNVVEGQHRFEAVKELRWTYVPVVQIIDVQRHVSENAVEAVMATGQSRDRAWQVVRNVAENIYEDGDMDGDYNSMGAWAPAFNAALEAIRAEGGLHDVVQLI